LEGNIGKFYILKKFFLTMIQTLKATKELKIGGSTGFGLRDSCFLDRCLKHTIYPKIDKGKTSLNLTT
jgi:hypothetical protein